MFISKKEATPNGEFFSMAEPRNNLFVNNQTTLELVCVDKNDCHIRVRKSFENGISKYV
jgi:hypothetical protein